MSEYLPLLLKGAWLTVQLAVVSVVLGIVFGLVGALLLRVRFAPVRYLVHIYSTLVRGLPELLYVLIFYYGASELVRFVRSSMGVTGYLELNFVIGAMALATMFGAYATEVFRMSIKQVDLGQWEAGRALGMQSSQIFSRLILPQVARHCLPAIGNLCLVTLKDTALVSLIGLHDLMFAASRATQATQLPFSFYMLATLMYLCMTACVMWWVKRIEHHSDKAGRYARRQGAV